MPERPVVVPLVGHVSGEEEPFPLIGLEGSGNLAGRRGGGVYHPLAGFFEG
jgi:hypothetical protein